MANASRDNNNIPTLLATSSADGTTPLKLQANPSTHVLQCTNGSGGSDLSGDNAYRDDNGEPVMMAVSSSDGVTPVPIYINSSNQILLKTT